MRKKMKNKSYAVIGLGQFGMTVALTLAEANCDVPVSYTHLTLPTIA